MRSLSAILLSAGLLGMAGCNEFVQSDARTSSVDVVGEPTDPVPDSMRQADILGSAVPSSDDSAPVSDTYAGRETEIAPRDMPSESVESEGDPDVAGGLGLAKPVSLKTKKPEDQSAKQNKP